MYIKSKYKVKKTNPAFKFKSKVNAEMIEYFKTINSIEELI